MTEAFSNGIEHSHTLLHNLGANTVAGQYRNFQFHNLTLYTFILYIAISFRLDPDIPSR